MASAVFLTLVLSATANYAQTTWRPEMKPLNDSGFASPEEVTAAVGNVDIDVVCPEQRVDGPYQQRGARLTVDHAETLDKRVLSTLLHNALDAVWDQCEMLDRIGESHGMVQFPVGFAQVYARAGGGGAPKLFFDARNYAGLFGTWDSIVDVAEQQREQAVQQQEQLQTQASEAQWAQDQLAARNERERENAIAWDAFWEKTWKSIKLVFFAAIGLQTVYLLILYRVAIARLYYFAFHPHPAEQIVRAALRTGTVLDGRALARALGEVPPGNSIFRKVRIEQGEVLVARMQRLSASKLRELERLAANDYERAAIISTREAIALAAIALEQAKAAWAASETLRTRRAI